MLLPQPLPFREAIERRAVQQLLPTELRTRLLSTIPAEVRERALFSAGVTNVELLQKIGDSVDGLVAGTTDRATQRAELKKLVRTLDLGAKTEDERGTLTDLGSDARLNLILDTQLRLAQGYGAHAQGNQPGVLEQFPAEELFDTNPGQSENRRDWAARWAELGGKFYDGRLIAKKGDPILTQISYYGLPYGPLAFRSFWERRDIAHDEAVDLGVVTPAEAAALAPQSRDFNTDLAATPEVRDAALKEGLLEALGPAFQFLGGILRLVRA